MQRQVVDSPISPMIEWLRALSSPLRYLIYLAGALLAFFVAVGVGAMAAVVSDLQPGRGVTGPADNSTPGRGRLETTGAAEEISFTHKATKANSRRDYTYISDPSINGDPDAVILVRPAPNQPGTATYGHNVGVWYEPVADKWAIFNQDRDPVPAGTTFEVVVPRESAAFVHQAGLLSVVGNSTYIDDRLTNGESEAGVSVTQNRNPGGGRGVYNDHPVAAFYDADVDKWAVYNRDDAPMPEGAAFNVYAMAADADKPAR